MYLTLSILFALVFLYSILAGGLERSSFSGALLFTTAGLALGPIGLDALELNIQTEGLKLLAELTLALVLFTDAANTNLTVLRRHIGLPLRLLLIGLPLTIFLGIAAGMLVFPGVTAVEIALLAALLAPTDAALGKAVVTSPRVPPMLRGSLNVESGLNDGICVPVVLSLLIIATEPETAQSFRQLAIPLIIEELGKGAVIGVVLAWGGHHMIELANKRGWIRETWRQITIIGLALLCFTAAQAFGGSGFIAAFVGGLVYGIYRRPYKHEFLAAAEGTGDAFALVTWVIFGAGVMGPALFLMTPEIVLYALLSLTVVRVLPVYLALLGTDLRPVERLFVGWFGPRGLASVVFAIIVLDEAPDNVGILTATAVTTISLSVVLHGLTAKSFTRIFKKNLRKQSKT